jgi:hypothetical protein
MPKVTRKSASRGKAARGPRAKQTEAAPERSAVDAAIASDLAPAAAIAILEKSSSVGVGENAPALDVLAAGVSDVGSDGKVHVQLLFENGAVLPLEMTREAGEALEVGLAKARQDDRPPPRTG